MEIMNFDKHLILLLCVLNAAEPQIVMWTQKDEIR
jgi:hypothetical protein